MNQDSWVPEVCLVQLVLQAEEEGVVLEVQLDLLDLWVNQDHLVEEECLEMMVHQDKKVNLVIGGLLDPLVQKVNKVVSDDLVHLECKA